MHGWPLALLAWLAKTGLATDLAGASEGGSHLLAGASDGDGYPQPPMPTEHYFICPHCGNRSMATDRNQGFRREARGCEKCGFAYLFELLDDYYPAPNAAFFACDADGRIVDCGKGSFELTGLRTEQVIGRHVNEALGLQFDDGTDHVGTALEWEVRVQGKQVGLTGDHEIAAKAVADIFPAYDDEEGGVLLVLTPTNNHSHPAA